MFNFVRIRVKLWGARGSNPMLHAVAPSLTLKTNKRASRRDNMKKYRVSLEVDKEWVKNFDLTFDAADEQDAEAQAMVEVKMNLGDYITAYADEEGDE